MKTKKILLSFLFFASLNSHAVDQEYLTRLKYRLIGMNLKLPNKIDEITTIEEMRIIQLKDGYYVVSMAKLDSMIKSFGNNRELIRTNSINTGCNDPATLEFMNNGMKIGILFKNSDGEVFDQIMYSLKDC